MVWRLWVIRKIFSGFRIGWCLVGSWKVVTIKQRWIDCHLRKRRIGPCWMGVATELVVVGGWDCVVAVVELLIGTGARA